jgi:hypothetical protein
MVTFEGGEDARPYIGMNVDVFLLRFRFQLRLCTAEDSVMARN